MPRRTKAAPTPEVEEDAIGVELVIDGKSGPERIKQIESLFGKLADDKLAAMAKVRPAAIARYRENMVRAQAALAPAPKIAKPRDTGPVPDCVCVCDAVRVTGPGGRTRRLKRCDIISGEWAAYLWEHHHECVDRYPPAT